MPSAWRAPQPRSDSIANKPRTPFNRWSRKSTNFMGVALKAGDHCPRARRLDRPPNPSWPPTGTPSCDCSRREPSIWRSLSRLRKKGSPAVGMRCLNMSPNMPKNTTPSIRAIFPRTPARMTRSRLDRSRLGSSARRPPPSTAISCIWRRPNGTPTKPPRRARVCRCPWPSGHGTVRAPTRS